MATTDRLWVCDPEIEDQIINVMTRLNGAGAELRLFTDSDFTTDDPTNPEAVTGDFTEPTLDGYAAADLEDVWTTPARDEAGVWSSQTEIITFTVDPAEVDSELVYGINIVLSGETKVWALFPSPIEWEDGVPIRVRVVYVQYAALSFKIIVES